jgi:hypothetical protein
MEKTEVWPTLILVPSPFPKLVVCLLIF